jgi:ABC-2 type transport system permease protein
MTAITNGLRDSRTMLRRNLVHMVRYPVVAASLIAVPVVLLLLFVFVFGDALGAGIGLDTTTANYIDYLVPGIIMMAVAGGAQGTAISVAMDMTDGIIARFRTMAITRGAVLTGHVLGSVIQTMAGIILVVAAALLVGFRPTATPVEWVATFGVVALITLAITWLSVALGTVSKTVEGASNLPLPLILLPFLSSGFVPTETLSPAVQWFAEHQPFTPFTETIRGLLMGTPIGNAWILTVVWCVVIGFGGYLWAVRLYDRRSIVPA